jgi:hypothetical protein
MRENTGLSFAFIVEWDNARLSQLGRTRMMLATLQKQVVAHLPRPSLPSQIVILYDRQQIDPKIIASVLAETIDPVAWDATIRIVATDGLGYYQLKNFGVPQTDREIVLFIDSDVIPEDGWLDAMLSAIEQPGVDIVSGNTYVAPESFFAKAFSVFWFFEMRSKTPTLYRHDTFFANNVAFRRGVLERYPFPDMRSFRGQCLALAETLKRDGVGVYRHDGARVSHPPTDGFSHFCRRAICEGHDVLILCQDRKSGRLLASPAGSLLRLGQGLKSACRRAVDHRRDVGLSRLGAAGAVGIGSVYCCLKLFGEVVTYFNPNIVRRYWPI